MPWLITWAAMATFVAHMRHRVLPSGVRRAA
jgi:hypothetical protein